MYFRIKKYQFVILVLILFFCFSGALSEDSFAFQRVGNIHPYEDNLFRAYSTESGTLTVSIRDSHCVYRVLSQKIKPGETLIHWDGCSYNKEKLYEKSYIINAVLETDSGEKHSVSFNSPIDYPGQFLLYALPSSDHLYLDSPMNWFLEYRTVKNGSIIIEITGKKDSSQVYRYSVLSNGGKMMRRDFSFISDYKMPAPGDYSVAVFESSKPDVRYEFPVYISENAPEPDKVELTGEIMPDRSMSEEEIWDTMMRPSVVIDIDFFKHQTVYSKPDPGSRSLGTLHGQTQGVKLIQIESEWALIGAWNHEDASYIEGWVPLTRLKVVKPQTEYGLLIDKKQQTLSVYRNGKKVSTLLVSTGKAEKNRLYQETSAGCFLTGYHRVNFSTNGKKYDYVIQYDGGNLLHQIPYEWGENKKDFTMGRGYLGAKASHACIRIQAEPDEDGYNAYWLFTHLPYHTRVIILDDPEEREATAQQLLRTEKSEMDLSLLHKTNQYSPDSDDTVLLTFGGSVIPGGSKGYNNRYDSLSAFVDNNGYKKPLSEINDYFMDDDLSCINLCGFFLNTAPAEASQSIFHYASGGMEEIFRDSSIELAQISYAPLYSAGTEYIRHTVDALTSYMHTLDKGKTFTIELKGHVFGITGCNESEYLSDPSAADTLIRSLKNDNCEKVVFLINWDKTKTAKHSIIQEAMAHRCVRAGADLIVGFGQGGIQGVDYIEGIPVVYSLGNLLDGSTSSLPKNHYGMIVRAAFNFCPEEESVTLTAVPILPYGKSINGRNNFTPTAVLSDTDLNKVIKTIWNDTTESAMDRIAFYCPD